MLTMCKYQSCTQTGLKVTNSIPSFRWVELFIEYIGECYDIEDTLKEIPPQIEEIYEGLLVQIQKGDVSRRQIAHRTFVWLCSSLDRLSSHEVIKAISWDLKKEPTLGEVHIACRHFVYVDSEIEALQFSHVSAFEFIKKQDLRWIESGLKAWQPSNPHHVQKEHHAQRHIAMAHNCLARLCNSSLTKSQSQASIPKSIAFRAYCYMYWAAHFAEAEDGQGQGAVLLRQLLAAFIRNEYCKWQIVLSHIVKNWLSNF